MTVDQVIKALWRRKLLVFAIAGLAFLVGAGIVASMPNTYEATVAIRLEPHHPIAEMVQPTISEVPERRVVTVRQELMARPVLQRAIEEMGLYREIVDEDGMDAAIERMRKDISVKLEGDSAFEFTYSGEDPNIAAQVANRLPQIFAEEGVKNRQAMAARTTRLFEDEVGSLKKAVTDWERKLAQFKVDHLGELPEQMEFNMRGLERVTAAIRSSADDLRAAEIRRADMLRAHYSGDSEAGRLQAQELETQRALIAAKAQWTADHPEVQKLARELSNVRARLKDAEGRLEEERRERARMAKVIASIEERIQGLHGEAEVFQARLQNTPKWAHELAVMSRDYEATRTKYESVLSRKVEAELAQELEARAAHDVFRVISAATIPVTPAKPDRMGGFLLAFLIALALGILVGVLVEMRDDSIRDPTEVKERLPIPVLAVVPQLGGKTERRVLAPEIPQRNVSADTLN
jgi:polysaccharide chain length determinant protein (PEP-CTERM system associated)